MGCVLLAERLIFIFRYLESFIFPFPNTFRGPVCCGRAFIFFRNRRFAVLQSNLFGDLPGKSEYPLHTLMGKVHGLQKHHGTRRRDNFDVVFPAEGHRFI